MFAKNLKASLLVFGSLFLTGISAPAQSPKYPVIQSWTGKVFVSAKKEERTELKRSFVLREYTRFFTAPGSSLVVQLDSRRTLSLQGAGELILPVISWETGEAPVVQLKSGQLRWLQNSADKKKSYNVALTSDLFEFIVPDGEFIFGMEPAKAEASVQVYQGQLEFSASNAEDSLLVKAGEQASFQGVLENGEIAYDILLQGRKIPKGKLSKISKMDLKLIKAEKDKALALEKAAAQATKNRQKQVAAPKKAGAICHGPEGLFNECAWSCEKRSGQGVVGGACAVHTGSVCVRRRCDANGNWADATDLLADKGINVCKSRPIVGPCDY